MPDVLTVATLVPFVVGSMQAIKAITARISQIPTIANFLAIICTLLVGPLWSLASYAVGVPGVDSWTSALAVGLVASAFAGWGYHGYMLAVEALHRYGFLLPPGMALPPPAEVQP